MRDMKAKPKTELQKTPELYRAKLNCKIARDGLDGKGDHIHSSQLTRITYALFCLCHAVEEIAAHLQKEAK